MNKYLIEVTADQVSPQPGNSKKWLVARGEMVAVEKVSSKARVYFTSGLVLDMTKANYNKLYDSEI